MLAVFYAKHYTACDANNRSVATIVQKLLTYKVSIDWKIQFATVLYLRIDKSVRHSRGNLQQHSGHIIVPLLAHCHGGLGRPFGKSASSWWSWTATCTGHAALCVESGAAIMLAPQQPAIRSADVVSGRELALLFVSCRTK